MITTIEEFNGLTQPEVALLLKAPVLISILAAGGDNELSEYEKAEVMKQAHLKTYTGIPDVHPYYKEVQDNFEENYNTIIERYIPFNDQTRAELTEEAAHINRIISKLDKGYANILRKSLGDYARHVKYADRKFVGNYVFPFAA